MTARWLTAGAVAVAALTGLASRAQADGPYGRYPSYGYQRDQYTRSAGFDRGFNDGLKHGRKDGDKRRAFNVARDDDFRDADNGYHSSYGPRFIYAAGYRDGYRAGYSRGYASSDYGRYYYGRGGYRDGYYRGDRDGYYRGDRDGYYRGDRDGYYDSEGRYHRY
jgi:hypothetical protein